MREAIAIGVIQLFALGIAWLVAIVVAAVAAFRMERRGAGALLLLATIVSLPAYLVLTIWYDGYSSESNFSERRAIAEQEFARFKELCAKPQQLSLFKTVVAPGEVDIRVQEEPGLYGLEVMEHVSTEKGICWTRRDSQACATPGISNVQWEFKSNSSWCLVPAPAKDCHLMWNYSVRTQQRSEISSIAATLVLHASRGERVSPLIERFRITVHEGDPSTPLAETFVYRKSWFGDLGPNPREGQEPRHCPDRDAAVGKLLESVLRSRGG